MARFGRGTPKRPITRRGRAAITAGGAASPAAKVVTVTVSGVAGSATARPGAVFITTVSSNATASGPPVVFSGVSTELTADELLSGGIPVRQEGARFDLYDVDGNLLGQLAVDREHAPRITNDINRPIRRTLDNLRIPPRPVLETRSPLFYAEDIEPLTMRLKVHWLLANGDEFPMGYFLWADDSEVINTWGEPRDGILVDQCLIVDQALERNVGYAAGYLVTDALNEQAEAGGINSAGRTIEASTVTLSEPIAWAAGRDKRLRVMESLCSLAGFLPPYFDNDGILVCRSAPDLATATPDFTYGYGTIVIRGSGVRSSDILSAPNRYVAIDSSAVEVELVGTFDVPDVAPHSYANRGFYIVETIDLQGLADQAAADQAAAAAYATDSSTFSWLAFETPPDPRNDTLDVISFDGKNYRQQAWSLELTPGARMSHDTRGAYDA